MKADEFGRDLTVLARKGLLDRVVGRKREMDQLLRVLCRRSKNNPLLIGDPGVGKTALVEGLAQELTAGTVPEHLRGRSLHELSLGALIAGTQFRGEMEKRLQDWVHRAVAGQWIVFIDEIHLLVVAGKGSGMDAANLLKPFLARGGAPCIGATTSSEAESMFQSDPALERRFQTVTVSVPDGPALEEILQSARRRLEAHHGFHIADCAVRQAIQLSGTWVSRRKNPDLAIDLLEDACAAVQLDQMHVAPKPGVLPPQIALLRARLERAVAELDVFAHATASQELTRAEKGLKNELASAESTPANVTAADIDQASKRLPGYAAAETVHQ